jgi:hypothetical protein
MKSFTIFIGVTYLIEFLIFIVTASLNYLITVSCHYPMPTITRYKNPTAIHHTREYDGKIARHRFRTYHSRILNQCQDSIAILPHNITYQNIHRHLNPILNNL